jgi:MFS family permease
LLKGESKIDPQVIQARARDVNKALFLAVLFVAVLGATNANLMVAALLAEIATDLHISVAVAGQLATATHAAWGASVFSVGPLSDSFGRRPIALAGLLLIAGSLIGCAFAPNFFKRHQLALRELVPIFPESCALCPMRIFSPGGLAVAIWRYHPLHSLGNYPGRDGVSGLTFCFNQDLV